jgi:hypothetical protein
MKLRGDHNQCPQCHEYFNSTAAFQKHRVGEYGVPHDPRRCLKVSEMVTKGMAKNSEGWWVTSLRNPIQLDQE